MFFIMTAEFVFMELRKVAKEAPYQIRFSRFMRGVKEKEYLVLCKIGAGNTTYPPLSTDAQKIRNLDSYKVNIRSMEQRNN
jgi:hypothetical protein